MTKWIPPGMKEGEPIRIKGCSLGPDAKSVRDVMEFMGRILPGCTFVLIERASGASEIVGTGPDVPPLILEFPASVGNRWTDSNPEKT